mgnify:CR=1 FL=1
MNHTPSKYYDSQLDKKETLEFIESHVSEITMVDVLKFETFMYYPKERVQKFYVSSIQVKNDVKVHVIDFVVMEFDEHLKATRITHNFATTELPTQAKL